MKYTYDKKFFKKIDNEKSAYWLGFIYADGNIYNNSLAIHLAAKDKNHLEKFKTDIKYNGVFYESLSNFGTETVKLQIGSKEIVQDLEALGLLRCKSLTQTPLKIEDSLQKHFWRGVFDGDGDINKTERTQNQIYWRMRLTGNEHTLEGFTKFLNENGIVNCKSYPHGKVRRLEVTKKAHVKNLALIFYHKAQIYLERKAKASLECLDHY